MNYIKGFTFGFMSKRGTFEKPEARESIRLLRERTGSDHVIFALGALQGNAQSVIVDYKGEHMVSDDELVSMADLARSLGMKIIIKPMVNCRNKTWRAHINFFDVDVPGEATWGEWFESYTEYQCHYAEIAEKIKAEMLIVGCEMVQAERRDREWRELIWKVRQIYHGPVSYNTDKYQEDRVSWWDAVDVISSSGYYPMNGWDAQLDRIEKVVKTYNKPFFFAEAGCPSLTGSSMMPNNWLHEGEINLREQESYYSMLFEKTAERLWVMGFGFWDWGALLYDEKDAMSHPGYGVFGKPAEKVIKSWYMSLK